MAGGLNPDLCGLEGDGGHVYNTVGTKCPHDMIEICYFIVGAAFSVPARGSSIF